MRIWYHFDPHATQTALSERAAVESLTRAGLQATPLGDEAPNDPGVVFFDSAGARVCEFLREVSRNGVGRVLAVGVSRSALAGDGVWRLLEAGAADVFSWDHSPDPASEVAARFERWEGVDRLLRSASVRRHMVGDSPAWVAVLRRVVEAARFTRSPVLLTGESGTGKELVARLIHALDPRPSKRNLVVLDCTTVVPELSGSEFFGHERGAFTGAVAAREGAFSLAEQGTLFLDEIGELPASLQAELLRVVQERTFKPVGSNVWKAADFRLVCATNRDLLEEEAGGRFRGDLYHRIAGWVFKLPPLRERPEDILPLARHFMRDFRPDEEPPELDEPVREYLLRRNYKGNVRELRQLIARVMSRHVGPGPVTAGDICEEERPAPEGGPAVWPDASLEQSIRRALSLGVGLKEIGKAATETAIRVAVGDEQNNLQRAAQKLGVTDRALQMRRAVRLADRKPQTEELTNWEELMNREELSK